MKRFLNGLMVPVVILSLSSCRSEEGKSKESVIAERPICSAEFLGKYNNLVDEINNSGHFQKKHTLTEEGIDFDQEYRKLLRIGIQSKVRDVANEESCKSGETIIHPFKDPTLVKVKSFVLSYDLLRHAIVPLKKFESETGIRFTNYAGPFHKLADIVDLKFYDQKYKELPDFHRNFKFVRSELNELRSSLLQLQKEFEEKGLKQEDFNSSGFQLVFGKTAALIEQITKDLQFIQNDRAAKGRGATDFDHWKFLRYSHIYDRANIAEIEIKVKELEKLLNVYKELLKDSEVESDIKIAIEIKIKTELRTEIAQICRKVLELPEDASDKMIKKAFNLKSLKIHPDKQPEFGIPQDQTDELNAILKSLNSLKDLHEDTVELALD